MESNLSIEHKSLKVLENYEGANNYILKLKQKFQTNKNFFPSRNQADYIITYQNTIPKVAKKWVLLDTYFAEKFANEKLLMTTPEKVWIEKLLVEKDKAYHVWGKFLESEQLYDFWLPKGSIVKNVSIEKVDVDYTKYSHRPPLEHQKEAIEKLVGCKRFILADDMGLGKAEIVDNLLFTPKGRKRIGDIKVGDEVIGSDGNPTTVRGVYPQGIKDTYKITFNDGFSIVCCGEHLWSVSSSNNGDNRNNERRKKKLVLTTKQMFDGGKITIKGDGFNKEKNYVVDTYYKSSNGNNKWQIPIVKPMQFNNIDDLPVDPYLLGLLLGDGGLTTSCIHFTSIDNEIINNVKEILTDDLEIKKISQNGYDYRIKTKKGKNSLIKKLKDLGVMGKYSYEKSIPSIYKYSSVENRISILQGLMDTDGHVIKTENDEFSGTEFSTTSKQLCNDVVEIVHSLGGVVRVKNRFPTYTYKGVKKQGKLSYRLNIKLPSQFIPFRLTRKVAGYNLPTKYKVGRYIKNIEYVGKNECVCISVTAEDKLYVTEHAIVTHNTTSTIIAALETGAKKILIVCPASLKINWEREIKNYTDRPSYICEGKNFSTKEDFIIINYDILKNFHDIKDLKNSPILNAGFDLIILDEAHMISNPQAQRTKIVNSFCKNAKYLWLLTGTPLTSRPMNYYNLLNLIESPVAANWMAYAIRYCAGYQFNVKGRKIWNVTGASNLEELRDRTSKQLLRRLKTDVLDLPEKIITPVYLRLKSRLYEGLMGEYYDWYNTKKEESSSLTIQFSKLMKVRQVIAEEKIATTIELAENIIEQGKKVVILTNFTDSLKKIHEHFGKQSVYLDGSCSKIQRQHAVDEFQENEKIKVFVGNLKAAGVGITLTAGEAVIMNDLSFVPAEHLQGEDRCYRYGQKNSVSIYYPLFENSIEMIIYDMLAKKKQIFETVMGDNMVDSTADVVGEIMSMINNQ